MLLILIALLILLLSRRSSKPDDRNLHLYDSHREGAAIAYIPELALQDNPFNSHAESDVDPHFWAKQSGNRIT